MEGAAAEIARAVGDQQRVSAKLTNCVNTRLTPLAKRIPYPEIFSAVWLDAESSCPQLVYVPMDYGAVRPHRVFDLCVHFWLEGGHPRDATRRNHELRATTLRMHDSINGFSAKLEHAVTIFTQRHTSGAINGVVSQFSRNQVEWHGPILAVLHQSDESNLAEHAHARHVTFLAALAVKLSRVRR